MTSELLRELLGFAKHADGRLFKLGNCHYNRSPMVRRGTVRTSGAARAPQSFYKGQAEPGVRTGSAHGTPTSNAGFMTWELS